MIKGHLAAIAVAAMAAWTGFAYGEGVRIKDLTNIRGVRANHLIGFGLVVGLSGTGDSKNSLATNKAAASMLTGLGMQTKSDDVVAGNIAAVLVTGELPAFGRIGDGIDVKLSAVGDAKSLAGGTLVFTPLRAADNQVYAVAQGSVTVGQADGKGAKVLTVALVPSGGVIEREFEPTLAPSGILMLSLKSPDFTTAARLAEEINAQFKGFYAQAKDLATISVTVPPVYQSRVVEFISKMEALRVQADAKAKVVMNERTGTVVMGQNVMIDPVTIAHGDLSIQVKGATAKAGDKGKAVVPMGGTTVGDLIKTMNDMGVKPEDLVGILQALHASGALQAELEFL